MKRNNTYAIINEEKSPIIEAMQKQQENLENRLKEEAKQVAPAFEEQDSSEDDEEFIRQSIINNQKRFKAANTNYLEDAFINRPTELKEPEVSKPLFKVSEDETPNGLSKLCDQLNSLNRLVEDKNDRIFTNFDCLLFNLNVSDVLKLQRCSRALYRIFGQDQLKRLVRIGNLDDDLRVQFWIHQAPFFSYQNEVRDKIGETDFFVNVYEKILDRLKTEPLEPKVIDEIGKFPILNILNS